jgi:mannosyltransferase OCH1-like enzyme
MREHRWAFLSDYARLRILYEQGGIYLDTDMLAIKSIGDLLTEQAFWGRANNGMIEPVVIGAVKNHPTVKACLDIYLNKSDSEYREIPLEIQPVFTALGFDEANESMQRAGSNVIYPFDYFCPMPFEQADTKDPRSFRTENTYAVHLWNAAWFDPFRFFWNGRPKKGWQAVWKTVLKNPLQGCAFYRNVAYHLKCTIFGYPT